MSVAISTFSQGGTGTNARMRSGLTGSTPLTLANFQNCGGADSLLVVQVAFTDTSAFIGTMTATFGSQTMTQIGTNFQYNGGSWCLLTFALVDPQTGLKPLVLSWTGGAGGDVQSAYGVSFTGTPDSSVAAATYGYTTNNNTVANATATVTSSGAIAAGDMAVTLFNASSGTGFSSTTGSTIDLDATQAGTAAFVSACESDSGAGSPITASATGQGSSLWGAAILGIKAAPPTVFSEGPSYVECDW